MASTLDNPSLLELFCAGNFCMKLYEIFTSTCDMKLKFGPVVLASDKNKPITNHSG